MFNRCAHGMSRHLRPAIPAEPAIKHTSMTAALVKEENEPELLSLNTSLILHMGKAGGTTVKIHTRERWRLFVDECHPSPCKAKHMNQPSLYLLPTLRDPVDRFVSAFYWRIERLCHDIPKENRTYGQYAGCQTWDKPNKQLLNMLYNRRQKNASLLAEDLCSTNATVAKVAKKDLSRLLHIKSKQNIVSWFEFDWTDKADHIFPLVLERGAVALESQVDTAVEWLYNETRFETTESFGQRRRFVQRQDLNRTNYRSSSGVKQALTPAAEQCLEQYYRKDYEMLRVIHAQLCKTGACRDAIQSILDRRKRVFGEEDVVVTIQ